MKRLIIACPLLAILFFVGLEAIASSLNKVQNTKVVPDNEVHIWTDERTCAQYIVIYGASGVAVTPRIDLDGKLTVPDYCSRMDVASK